MFQIIADNFTVKYYHNVTRIDSTGCSHLLTIIEYSYKNFKKDFTIYSGNISFLRK